LNELGLQEDERLAMLEEEARQARLSKKNGLSQETPSSSFFLNSGFSFYMYRRRRIFCTLYGAVDFLIVPYRGLYGGEGGEVTSPTRSGDGFLNCEREGLYGWGGGGGANF
jgi:hypothetical protein